MSVNLILGIIFLLFVSYKTYSCWHRYDLSKFEEIKLYFSYALFVLFLITSYTLPYPQSLYWFILLSVILIGGLLSSKLVRTEVKRQLGLPRKELITNVLFYSLMMVTFFSFF